MKKFYSLFIALLVVALLAGCSKSAKLDPNATNKPASDIVTLKQAVQTFNTQEGHFPKTLDELTPKYIAQIPAAPAGYTMTYDPTTGEVKLNRAGR
jgi:outer membrane murein-binding lipoprotein Lpp